MTVRLLHAVALAALLSGAQAAPGFELSGFLAAEGRLSTLGLRLVKTLFRRRSRI